MSNAPRNLQTYVNFDGNCAEVFAHYAKVLGGKVTALHTFGNSPFADKIGPEMKDRILHGTVEIAGQVLMGSDIGPWHQYDGLKGFYLSLDFATLEAAQAAFDALAEGGSVQMPMDKAYFAEAFGMLTDKFGMSWMIGVHMTAPTA